MSKHHQKEIEQYEALYQTWEFLASVHGVKWEHPLLKEKRRELGKKKEEGKPPIPLHLKMAMAGIQVKTKEK